MIKELLFWSFLRQKRSRQLFKEKRYIRIGSSKANLKDYPKREIQLFKILDGRVENH